MFVKLRSFKGKKELYFCLQESYRVDGKSRTRHVAYLGKNPVGKLKKLIMEGKLTEEQLVDITFTNDFSRSGYELMYFLQELRSQKSVEECTTKTDALILKTAKINMWLRVENNNKYIRGKKKVRASIEQLGCPR